VPHRKIKFIANPVDPQWESYFEKRLGLGMRDCGEGLPDLSGVLHFVGLLRDRFKKTAPYA
jgi:hypothetical protein